MKWYNKLKLLVGVKCQFLLALLSVLFVAKCSFAQGHQYPSFHRRWGNAGQYQYPQSRSYFMSPTRPLLSPFYHHRPRPGGRIFESVKASVHPLQIHSDTQGSLNSPPPLYSQNSLAVPASAPAQYSGYFYLQDKHRKPIQPPAQPFYTNAYNFPSSGLWTPVAATPPVPVSHPNLQTPLTRPSLSPQQLPHTGLSGPVASASMDTYQEALDLYSEVVHKLEKETGRGHQSGIQHSPSYVSSLLSNNIYGSAQPSSISPNDFPHQLDHIMGPEFLARAHKLYNKIIKEQNSRVASPHYHSPSPYSSPYYASRVPNSPHGGLSYLEGVVHGASYERPSQYARNIIVDSSDSSLLDTVKSLEVDVSGSGQSANGGAAGSAEELMVTSESNMSPQSQLQENPSPNDEQLNSTHQLSSADSTAASQQDSPDFSGNIPLSENDFVEHPLPYEEYEGLIKDIAMNHNY